MLLLYRVVVGKGAQPIVVVLKGMLSGYLWCAGSHLASCIPKAKGDRSLLAIVFNLLGHSIV